MFNATHFIYNSKSSAEYDLHILDFDTGSVVETDAFSPTLVLQKVPGSLRFLHGGIEYDSAPTCEFSVLSQSEITATKRSEILSWLIGRKQFKPLQFVNGDNGDFTYYCVFTSARTIWVNGRCHGFRLTAQFDSQFARGTPVEVEVPSSNDIVIKTINNQSNLGDEYTYPIVSFWGTSIEIYNLTDDPAKKRPFKFESLNSDEYVTVDNEVKHITSTTGDVRLANFTSKKWLRLRPGENELSIYAPGGAKIICPTYVMIGY